LHALATTVGFAPPEIARANRLFERMASPWGAQPIGTTARWPSDVGDDHSPYEFSYALGGVPELRILIEPMGTPPSLDANRVQALGVLDDLASDHDINLQRLNTVADLFLPKDPRGLFSIWLAASLWPGRAPEFKVYLNPEAQGRALAPALIEEAMVRLGLPRGWNTISKSIARRGPDLDELKYFSCDLSNRKTARVKVYARHHTPTVADLEMAASAGASHVAGDLTTFLGAMTATSSGEQVLVGPPAATCLAFIDGDGSQAALATHYFPVKGYVPNDAVAAGKLGAFLEAEGMSASDYERPLRVFAERPLETDIGVQSYISFRRQDGRPRITVYLATELYKPGMASLTKRETLTTSESIVARFEREPITNHPLFRRLEREPVSITRLWILLANAQLGIVNHFARRLAHATAQTDDDRIRSLMARQLHDELGEGHYERAHSRLFAAMMAGLAPWRPAEVTDAMLRPGVVMNRALDAVYLVDDRYQGIGCSIVAEVFGKQVDQFTGAQFRRQSVVDPASLSWLNLHETLEVSHANEALDMARLLPVEGFTSALRGAEGVWLAANTFFDGVYEVAFGG
jgi:DMATS type aromatic prenyltransferase